MYFRQFRCIYAIYSLALLTAEYKLLGTGQVKKVNMPLRKKKDQHVLVWVVQDFFSMDGCDLFGFDDHI